MGYGVAGVVAVAVVMAVVVVVAAASRSQAYSAERGAAAITLGSESRELMSILNWLCSPDIPRCKPASKSCSLQAKSS